MQGQLIKLKALYSELIDNHKKMDAARMWCLWNGCRANYPMLPLFNQKILNIQNEIDNILTELVDEYGDDFIIKLEKIMFADVPKKDVAN